MYDAKIAKFWHQTCLLSPPPPGQLHLPPPPVCTLIRIPCSPPAARRRTPDRAPPGRRDRPRPSGARGSGPGGSAARRTRSTADKTRTESVQRTAARAKTVTEVRFWELNNNNNSNNFRSMTCRPRNLHPCAQSPGSICRRPICRRSACCSRSWWPWASALPRSTCRPRRSRLPPWCRRRGARRKPCGSGRLWENNKAQMTNKISCSV